MELYHRRMCIETTCGRAGLGETFAGIGATKDKRSSQGGPVDTRETSVGDRALEAERYRAAAELALDQLQWSINYLYSIRKPALARRLNRNREHIRAQL